MAIWLPMLMIAQAVPVVGDYWPGPWVVFTDRPSIAEAPPVLVDVAKASRRLPAVRLALCAEGARGGEDARIDKVRHMLIRQDVAAARMTVVDCPDRDVDRPAGVRIAIR